MEFASGDPMDCVCHVNLAPVKTDCEQQVEDAADPDLFKTDEFRIYCYKVLPCPKKSFHNWTLCPFAHQGEKSKRRDPRKHNYLAIPCPEAKQNIECPRGEQCPYAHNVFEFWLHPSRYRTQMCQKGAKCRRDVCFFAHKEEELRTHRPVPASDKADCTITDEETPTSVASDKSFLSVPSEPNLTGASVFKAIKGLENDEIMDGPEIPAGVVYSDILTHSASASALAIPAAEELAPSRKPETLVKTMSGIQGLLGPPSTGVSQFAVPRMVSTGSGISHLPNTSIPTVSVPSISLPGNPLYIVQDPTPTSLQYLMQPPLQVPTYEQYVNMCLMSQRSAIPYGLPLGSTPQLGPYDTLLPNQDHNHLLGGLSPTITLQQLEMLLNQQSCLEQQVLTAQQVQLDTLSSGLSLNHLNFS